MGAFDCSTFKQAVKPKGLYLTVSVWPLKVCWQRPWDHSLMVASLDPVRKSPFGSTSTAWTGPSCPDSSAASLKSGPELTLTVLHSVDSDQGSRGLGLGTLP